jgi:hypothetical protein
VAVARVTLHADPRARITTLTAVGPLTADELIAALGEYYEGSPTPLAVCDLSAAKLALLTADDIARIVAFTIVRAEVRAGGKTAILAPGDLEYGMARMYEVLCELRKHPVVIRAFRERDEALAWLREPR